MSGSNDDGKLNAEDQATLAEYENSDAAGAKAQTLSRAAELTKLFYKTAEMQDYSLTLAAIEAGLDMEDTVTVKIDVPRAFIRLTEFLELKRVTAAGVEPLPPQQVLNQVLLNELHDQLHGLITGPTRFRYYRDLWNRFCDEQNAPDQKIHDPQAAAPEDGNGPF